MLFRKKIDPRCAYCEKGTRIDDAHIACVKKGIVAAEEHCHRFKYDPLKRVPPRPVRLDTTKLSQEDFEL